MKAFLLLLALAALPLVGSAVAAEATAPPTACAWNPRFTDPLEQASGGIIHFHDGVICTVHLHL